MRRIKLYFYPQAAGMVHDASEWYRGVVPFCEEGIKRWVDVVGMGDADYYHMGQIREFQPIPYNELFGYWKFRSEPGKHIVDLEGDYAEGMFREEFSGAVRVACGAPHRWRASGLVYPRPTMSRLLLELVRGKAAALPLPGRVRLGMWACRRMLVLRKGGPGRVRRGLRVGRSIAG